MMKNSYLLLILSFLSFPSFGQKFGVSKIGIGAQVFEFEQVGSDPLSAVSFVKDPLPYFKIVNDLQPNSFASGRRVSAYSYFYVQADFKAKNPESRFWKKNVIQTGLFLSKRFNRSVGALSREDYFTQSDTVFKRTTLMVHNTLQNAGLFLGLNKRLRLNKNLDFHIGFRAQGMVAITNYYVPSTQIGYSIRPGYINLPVSELQTFKGNHYFQWQFNMPFGIIYDLFDNKYSIRLDLMPGVLAGKYKQKKAKYQEANGIGLSIMYTLK